MNHHLAETATRSLITQKSGISIALVCIIVAGIASNVSMMFALRGDIALVQKDVGHVGDDVLENQHALSKLTDETRIDLRSLREEVTGLRLRVNELEK